MSGYVPNKPKDYEYKGIEPVDIHAEHWVQYEKYGKEPPPPPEKVKVALRIGVFFDGTGNSASNAATGAATELCLPAKCRKQKWTFRKGSTALVSRRVFSQKNGSSNMLYLDDSAPALDAAFRVGFLLLEHFSMTAFTAAMDVLVTANLLRNNYFKARPLTLSCNKVVSDLGLEVTGEVFETNTLEVLDILVVCGGFRTPLKYSRAA